MGVFSGSGVVLLHGDGDLGGKGGSSWLVRVFFRVGGGFASRCATITAITAVAFIAFSTTSATAASYFRSLDAYIQASFDQF